MGGVAARIDVPVLRFCRRGYRAHTVNNKHSLNSAKGHSGLVAFVINGTRIIKSTYKPLFTPAGLYCRLYYYGRGNCPAGGVDYSTGTQTG